MTVDPRDVISEDKHMNDDEPWRYRCPYCSTPEPRKRTGHVHQMSDSEGGAQYPRHASAGKYYCDSCQTPLTVLYDAREDERIRVGTIEP